MAVYYIDPVLGNDENDGLSECIPKKDYSKIDVKGGDSILFKCGSFIRSDLKNVYDNKGEIITYGSYGDGEKPVFCGSVDTLSNPEYWYEESTNIWVTDKIDDEACNFIFNNEDLCGTLRWTKEELCEQGDFFDECFGFRVGGKKVPEGHKIYMFSVKNPAEYYSHIEVACYCNRWMATSGDNLLFENLRFINGGVHGIAGGQHAENLHVRNCDFEFIGGCVWNYELKIRFGNAFECWDIAENISVKNCYFYNIYDSAVTHQGSKERCEPCVNFVCTDCVFVKCGMGAYEQRDLLPLNAVFSNNICIDAGEGFSKQGEIMPRYSEIWPQPMGHHVFLWRIDETTRGGKIEIKNNIFSGAPYGASIYSIICEEAENQIELEGNIYCTTDSDELVSRWGKINYKSFEEYKKAGIEKKPESKKIDISKYLK